MISNDCFVHWIGFTSFTSPFQCWTNWSTYLIHITTMPRADWLILPQCWMQTWCDTTYRNIAIDIDQSSKLANICFFDKRKISTVEQIFKFFFQLKNPTPIHTVRCMNWCQFIFAPVCWLIYFLRPVFLQYNLAHPSQNVWRKWQENGWKLKKKLNWLLPHLFDHMCSE